MTSNIQETRRRAASRDITPSLPSSHTSSVRRIRFLMITLLLNFLSQSSYDSDNPATGKVKQVIECCRRRIERFTGVPRSDVYANLQSQDSSSCFERRRPKSNSSPPHTHPRRTRTSLTPPVNLAYSQQESYELYMDQGFHPFITTPSCLEQDSSPKPISYFTPPSL